MNKIDFIARIRHLCWCCYQLGAGQPYNIEPNEDQIESQKDGVRFMLENPDITPEENHNNWMKMKKGQGWVYGEIKSFEKKTHPDLVPFEELPEVEKNKDVMDAMAHKGAVELCEKVGVIKKEETIEEKIENEQALQSLS